MWHVRWDLGYFYPLQITLCEVDVSIFASSKKSTESAKCGNLAVSSFQTIIDYSVLFGRRECTIVPLSFGSFEEHCCQ